MGDKEVQSIPKRLKMDLPGLPPLRIGSFPTVASSIESMNLVPVQSLETQGQRSTNHTQQAVDALNHAITKAERVEALKAALHTFSHNNESIHDYEIQLCADKALCLKLGYIAVTSSSPFQELFLIGKCLLQVYQCSSEQRKRSFRSIGATELVPLLTQVLMNTMKADHSPMSKECNDALMVVVQVLRVYAKLESAKSILLRLGNGTWLGQLLHFCVETMRSRNESSTQALCFEGLGLVKDLIFRSSEKDKGTILSLRDGIFGGLLASVCKAGETADPHVVEWFTAVIWNLVLEKKICDQIMGLDKAHDFPILRYLLRILSKHKAEHGSQDSAYISKLRRNVTSAIGNVLAHIDYQKVLLCDTNEKEFDIIEVLIQLVDGDEDAIVRRRAMRTLRCVALSGIGEVRAQLIQKDIPSLLARCISHDVSSDDDGDRDMQIQACQTIAAIMEDLSNGDWPRIETALLQRVETTNDDKLILAACACLCDCVKKSPWRRGTGCFTEMFWMRLEAVASTTTGSLLPLSSLLLELASTESDSIDASSDRQSSLANSIVVNTLTHLISRRGKDQNDARDEAVKIVSMLARNEANKRPLAENENLLSALVNLCLLDIDADRKTAAKKIIINLVPEL